MRINGSLDNNQFMGSNYQALNQSNENNSINILSPKGTELSENNVNYTNYSFIRPENDERFLATQVQGL